MATCTCNVIRRESVTTQQLTWRNTIWRVMIDVRGSGRSGGATAWRRIYTSVCNSTKVVWSIHTVEKRATALGTVRSRILIYASFHTHNDGIIVQSVTQLCRASSLPSSPAPASRIMLCRANGSYHSRKQPHLARVLKISLPEI